MMFREKQMKNGWIARIGLWAAAGVLVASLTILALQGGQMDDSNLRSLSPAQIPNGAAMVEHIEHSAAH